MQQKIHPGIAFGVILVVLGVVGFMLWWPNRPRPLPDHFGPLSQAQGMHMLSGGPANTGTPSDSSGKKMDAKPKGAPVKAKDSKPAGDKMKDSKADGDKAKDSKAAGN